MSLTKQSVVVVTGAGSGIGRALAKNLANEQIAGIAISDINEKALTETAESIKDTGVKVFSSVLNVSNYQDFEKFSQETKETFGRVTHLINNAGVGMIGRFEQLSLEDIKWMMDINFWGTVYGTKLFLPIIKKEKIGHITNISSVFGLISPPGQTAYCASKFAVRGLTESLRNELDGTNVYISVVHPGGIKTNIVSKARLGEAATEKDTKIADEMFEALAKTTPEKAAETIITGIKNKNPRILIGLDARQISFIQRLFPKRYFNLMDKLMGGMLSKYK